MAGQEHSPEYLAETNSPHLDQHVSIAFIVIDTCFLVLFYISRKFNNKAVGIPMLACNTLCYVLCMGSAATGILMVQIGGVGHHAAAIPATTFETWLQLSKVLEFTYTPAVMFAKLATLFLYRQVFDLPVYRRIINAVGVISILQVVVSIILTCSICRPFSYFWTQAIDIHGGTCGDVMHFYWSYSVLSLVTDVVMLVLPFPILLRLHVPTSDKIGLILTFLAASMGIITCALRFTVFLTVPLFSDPTWYASGGPMIYALVEPSIYMIASILPTTRHLYRRVTRKARRAGQPRTTNYHGGSRTDSLPQSEDCESFGIRETTSRRTIQNVEIWPGNTNSSQEELTLGEWHPNQQEWNRMHDYEGNSHKGASVTRPRELVTKQIEVRDEERPIE